MQPAQPLTEEYDLPAPKRRRRLLERGPVRRSLPWLVVIGMFALWELFVRLFRIEPFVLPAPSAIFAALWQWRWLILDNSWQTLMTTLVGFGLAIVIGALGGIALGSSAVVYESFYPALIGFNSVPKVAVIPILIIWFGIGTIPAIITAFLLAFFPILVNVATGIATVEPELRDVLFALGASRRQVIMKVGLPRSMPYFFASLKIAIALAFVGAVVSETVAADRGIGYMMIAASSRFDVPLVFAGLIVVATMGVVMYVACALIERRYIGWAVRGVEGFA